MTEMVIFPKDLLLLKAKILASKFPLTVTEHTHMQNLYAVKVRERKGKDTQDYQKDISYTSIEGKLFRYAQ